MAGKCEVEKVRGDIVGQLAETRSGTSTVDTLREDTNCRGDDYISMIRTVDELQLRAFNDKNEFDIDVLPGVIFESL